MKRLGPLPRPVLIGGIAQVVGAAALIGFMFLPWYGLGDQGVNQDLVQRFGLAVPSLDVDAWEAFGGTDVGLVLCALVFGSMGLSLGIGEAVPMGRTAVRVLSILGAAFAAIAVLTIVVKIVNPPGEADLSVKIGAFLGLFAALIALAGAAVTLFASLSPAEAWEGQSSPAGRVLGRAPGAAAANWYPDPEDSTRLRYWDGERWTEHFSPR
jgi:hypothetical protein